MAKKTKVDVDEDLVRQMIAGQIPLTTKVSKTVPDAESSEPEEIFTASEQPSVVETSAEDISRSAPQPAIVPEQRRRRTMTMPNYEQTFLTPVEYDIRASLYVSISTKRKILEILKRIGSERLTATSYVDNILRHHIEAFRDDINRIDQARNAKHLV